MQTTKQKHILKYTLCTMLAFAGFWCFFSAYWFVETYGQIGFDSVIFTLTASLSGVQKGLIIRYLLFAMLPTLCCTTLTAVFLIFQPFRLRKVKFQSGAASRKRLPLAVPVLLSLVLLICAAINIQLVDYLLDQKSSTELYERYYVDPDETKISFPEEKRNLIYIMLESMEVSYLSKDLGGALDQNLIPELYKLAEENTCFSHSDSPVGGFYTTSGATWTIGAMVAQTAGIPLKTPTEDVNQYGAEGEDFLPGVTSLTSILDEEGYNQALMVGSDAAFGGRKPYFLQHGLDAVYDIYTARKDGIIPKDYFVWWGMEDKYLFEYAKQEITEMAEEEEPFAFTMLTVDTHHVGGYQCEYCEESTSGETYDQSISCSSRQVDEFVDWIQDQEFYEDTTIIIVGDHESMDNGYFERNVDEDYQRLLYNCFINADAETDNVTNRKFAGVDLFPTTLAALGCEIEGDRLGLGTNLFSEYPTLMEQIGFSHFDSELAKASDYYTENFH